jgi:dTDP-4-amino-4,6-dideoxygalactose transaminase
MSGAGRELFRSKLGASLGVPPEHITLFAKGRVALYAILRALDIGPGDEVVVPAFTCVAVPNAILYTGARPVYVDIDAATYTVDPSAVEAAITPRTRVILAQNTFGLSADLDRLEAVATRHGLQVVDDCAHGMGGEYGGQPNGSRAAFSFFSTQWSKPISTGLGGVAVAQDERTAERLRSLEAEAREPNALRVAMLRVLVTGEERAGHGRLFRAGRSAYRVTGRLGLVPGSSDRQELGGIGMPDGFLAGISDWQARRGAERLQRLVDDVRRRRSIAGRYSAWLRDHDRTPAAEPTGVTHSFLRYPLRVRDKDTFVTAADRAGINLGDWFVSPLHPITTGLDRWGYVGGSAPVAEAACSEIVDLPTEPGLSDRDIDGVLRFLETTVDSLR